MEDETSLQDNERFIDEITKVPATSEDFSHSPHRRGTGGGRYQRGNNQTFLTVSVSQVILLNWRHHHHRCYWCPTGISGWEKVGCSAAGSDWNCPNIIPGRAHQEALWCALNTFNVRHIDVYLKSQASLRGRFCSQKQSGYTIAQHMKRDGYITLYNYFEYGISIKTAFLTGASVLRREG